ncbi:uncharacterized protein LOC129296068 [Prosopis cineraria]|uniref:uncharacterized protein LOC129296068 n=1 Tax=Prosopis cineraria TaxID=364024 RepID=UPI0024102E54|nr:uncharacterized protein LOC129296068 [Prosopis cineraria]
MEHTERKGPRMSVPQFGGWDQNGGAEVSSGYTVVFTKARADRQHHKTDLSDIKRQSQLQDHHHHHHDDIPKNHHHHHHNKHDRHHHGTPEERPSASATPNPMGKKRNKKSWFFCCIRLR